MTEYDIVVVGSCMIDLVCYAPRLPRNGETICGTNFHMAFGGKGCNQCVSARKLGGNCLLVARLGNDSFGKNYCQKLKEYGIVSRHVKTTPGVSTGTAQITVSETGENQIVIVMGANAKLSESDVNEASEAIVKSKVLVCQLEISENTTLRALQIKSTSKTGRSILNAAPATANMNPLLYSLPDIFCVNETEAETLTNVKVESVADAELAAKNLLGKGCKSVIITLGEKGSVYAEAGKSKVIHVPTLDVKAVDTTGAGDAFIGALAYYLSVYQNFSMEDLIKRANGVAALSVQRIGTQESFPGISDLPQHLSY